MVAACDRTYEFDDCDDDAPYPSRDGFGVAAQDLDC